MELNSHIIEDVKVLRISGRFDTHSASQVRDWLETVSTQDPANIVINLNGVGFIDSTGLSTLVQGMKRSREASGDLFLCCMRQSVRMILELTRLDKIFEIYVTEDEAVQAYRTKTGTHVK